VEQLAAATTNVPSPLGHGLAIFDLDRTLIGGSSLVPFGHELVRRGLVDRRTVARHLVAAAVFQRRGLGDRGVERVQARLLSVLCGHKLEPLEAAAADVGSALAELAFRSARWLLDQHLSRGDLCVVLTAAPQQLAEAVAHRLGAHRAIGTRLAVADAHLTGEIDGVVCHGPGKLVRLREEVGDVDWSHAAAYGDSASDVPVLERCRTPVAVNPDRRLRQIASERGWPMITFD